LKGVALAVQHGDPVSGLGSQHPAQMAGIGPLDTGAGLGQLLGRDEKTSHGISFGQS
jgi:hypothetical protein